MGFISERITTEDDKNYFNAYGFNDILGKPAKAYWWAIDREREIFLFPRGGGSFEIPLSFGLCVEDELIEIEAKKVTNGNINTDNLEIHWIIGNVIVPEKLLEKGYTKEGLSMLITEAFQGLGDTGVSYTEIKKITIENPADILIK